MNFIFSIFIERFAKETQDWLVNEESKTIEIYLPLGLITFWKPLKDCKKFQRMLEPFPPFFFFPFLNCFHKP